MKILLFLLVGLLPSAGAWACAWCRPRVQAGIHNAAYTANVGLVLLPVAVLLALGLGLFYWDRLGARFAAGHASR